MIRILTAYHFQPKPEELVENQVYRPMVLPVRDPLTARDPVMAENSFAEMRAHHWVQLNWESGITHYGFQHYRRWFFPEIYGDLPYAFNIVPKAVFDSMLAELRAMAIPQQEILAAWVEQFDIVTVRPHKTDLGAHFMASHGISQWQALMDALDTIKWDGPRDASVLYPANMFIIRSEFFARYMIFWRVVMDLLSLAIKPERGTYQERMFGFLSERLWTLWLLHEKRIREVALKEVPVVMCEEWKA